MDSHSLFNFFYFDAHCPWREVVIELIKRPSQLFSIINWISIPRTIIERFISPNISKIPTSTLISIETGFKMISHISGTKLRRNKRPTAKLDVFPTSTDC